MTIYGVCRPLSESSPESKTATIPEWLKPAAASASLRKRARNVASLAKSLRKTFTATSRANRLSCAR